MSTHAATVRAFFRTVNDRIVDPAAPVNQTLDVVCECDSLACITPIAMTPAQYRAIRAADAQQIRVRAHADVAGSTIVSEHDGFVVVVPATD